jgi:hypothetical protein
MLGKVQSVNMWKTPIEIRKWKKFGKTAHIYPMPFVKDGLVIMKVAGYEIIQFQISSNLRIKVAPLWLSRLDKRVGYFMGVAGFNQGMIVLYQERCRRGSRCSPKFHLVKYDSRQGHFTSYKCKQPEFYYMSHTRIKRSSVCIISLPRGCRRRKTRFDSSRYLLKINSVTALCYCANKGEALIYDVSPEIDHRKYMTSSELPVLVKGIRGHPMYFHLFLNGDLLYVGNKPKKHNILTYFSGEIVFWKRSKLGYARVDRTYFMSETHCENVNPFVELYTVDEHNMIIFLHVSCGDLWMIFQLRLNHMRTSRHVLAQFLIQLETKSVIYPMWGRYMVSFFTYKTRKEDAYEIYPITKMNITEYDPN